MRILKTLREKRHIPYKGVSIQIKANFSLKIMEVKNQWDKIFKVRGWGGRKTIIIAKKGLEKIQILLPCDMIHFGLR